MRHDDASFRHIVPAYFRLLPKQISLNDNDYISAVSPAVGLI